MTRIALRVLLIAGLAVCAVAGGSALEKDADEKRGLSLDSPYPGLVPVPLPPLQLVDRVTKQRLLAEEGALTALVKTPPVTSERLGQAYGRLGQYYQAQDFFDSAMACYRNAVKLEPRSFLWHYLLGYGAQELGDWPAAAEALEQALQLRPQDHPALFRLGEAYSELERYDLARKHLQQLLELDPNHAAALAKLGETALAQAEYVRAISLLERALEVQPEATRLYYFLALAHRQLGDAEKAAELMDRRGTNQPPAASDPYLDTIASFASGVGTRLYRASTALKQGRDDLAEEEYRRVLKLDPDQPIARFNLGVLAARAGDLDSAERHYRIALNSEPANADAHAGLANVFNRTGRTQEALEHLRQAVELNPGHRVARFNLGNTLRRSGKCERALVHFEQLLTQEPAMAAARFASAFCLARMGRYPEARDTVQEGLSMASDDWQLLQALARILAASPDLSVRNGEAALQLAQSAFARSKSLDTAESLAMAYAETGDYARAVALQQQLVDAATKTRDRQLVKRVQANLTRYRNDKPCRVPWP